MIHALRPIHSNARSGRWHTLLNTIDKRTKRKMAIDYVGFVTAAIVACAGAYGFNKSGSVPSLIAGLLFGALIAVGAYFTSQEPPKPVAELVILILLAGFMGFRWSRSGSFAPSGIITVILLLAFFINLFMYREQFRTQIKLKI